MEILTLPVLPSAQVIPTDPAAEVSSALPGLDIASDLFATLFARQLNALSEAPADGAAIKDAGDEPGTAGDAGAITEPWLGPEVAGLPLPTAVPLPPAVPSPAAASLQAALPESPEAANNAISAGASIVPDLPPQRQAVAIPDLKPDASSQRQAVAAALAGFAEPGLRARAELVSLPVWRNATPGTQAIGQESTIPLAAEQGEMQAAVGDMQPAAGEMSPLKSMTAQVPAFPAPPATPAALPSQATGSIAQPVESPAWGAVLGERVVWMLGQQNPAAELRLNPPSLGPLEVKLSVSDGQANLTFSTQHALVGEAIEAATPRLREMLGESGISLGNVSVNVGSFTQQRPDSQAQGGGGQRGAEPVPPHDLPQISSSVVTVLRGQQGMVDVFA